MIFHQLFDPASSTYTYILAGDTTLDAVIVDPVLEQRELATRGIHNAVNGAGGMHAWREAGLDVVTRPQER